MISKRILAITAAAAALTFAAPAQAEIFKYRQSNGVILTINTETGNGTMIGRDINVSFTSNDLKGFTGGANPSGQFRLDNMDGYRIINGRRQYDNTIHQQKLIFGNDRVNLWSYWGSGRRYGDYVTSISNYTPPTGSSGGSTGGSTSTGGGSTGGTDVPAPGMMLLFGMGAGALAWRRRRNKKA